MKPGFKTTEFWVTLLVQALGILALTGVLTPEMSATIGEQGQIVVEAIGQIAGALMAAISATGYAKARGEAKKTGEGV